ncbi:MAG: N-6 DNA methylase [Actinomycetaceae bacterium]|nr:N-6 DNA methylase [Actinomycetaceae bacterium]
MSFVPAVFKKELSQYFTPISLIETVVKMVGVGITDKVVDPAMGTGDFLAAALAERKHDDDIHQRLFDIDRNQSAFELAIVNMILNKDGQTGLKRADSIENHKLWEAEMNVAFCNPPFGSRTLEKRESVLKAYDLGYKWEEDDSGLLSRTDEVLPSQQLGILFIERCWKMLVDGGRLGIILPEGYLSGARYKYLRKWILDHFIVHALVELPRRMFVKSDADLRSNILVLEKKDTENADPGHKVYASMVRKVGYKLSGDFSATPQQDPETGLILHDEDNDPILDSDFNRVLDEYASFKAMTNSQWEGAHLRDILNHPDLDMKPRRLVPRAVQLMHSLDSDPKVVRLGDIAKVITTSVRVSDEKNKSEFFRPIEGQNIRAVEGIVSPGDPERGWHIAQRKASTCYPIKQYDIMVGLVRPERRNVGLVLDGDDNLVGIKDGVAVVRATNKKYPAGWLFYALRREETRIQMWINAGGTSYGKLSIGQIEDLKLRVDDDIDSINKNVMAWVKAQNEALKAWQNIGTPEDRKPILNSPLIGLIENADDSGED